MQLTRRLFPDRWNPTNSGERREMRRRLSIFNKSGLLAVMAVLAAPAAADEATIINNPAEKYAIAPGGIDMRTGQYVYSQTDLSIGPDSGGIALTRTTPVYENRGW